MQFVCLSGLFLVVAFFNGRRKTSEGKRIAIASQKSHHYPVLTIRSFVTGLVSATKAEVTGVWVAQLVDIVGAAVLYLNDDPYIATGNMIVNADYSLDLTLSHCWMISTQPGREGCITSVLWWTCGHHFCSCSSLEAIPAIEVVVTFGVDCYVVIFSFCICQILVTATYIN